MEKYPPGYPNGWNRLASCLEKNSYATTFVLIVSQIVIYQLFLKLIGTKSYLNDNRLGILIELLIILVIMMVIHEFVHILFLPCSITSDRILVGGNMIYKIIPITYVRYIDEMTKLQSIVFRLMPFVILTLIPTTVMVIFGIRNNHVFFFIMLNACGSVVDIIVAIEILFKLPRNSYMYMGFWRNK